MFKICDKSIDLYFYGLFWCQIRFMRYYLFEIDNIA